MKTHRSRKPDWPRKVSLGRVSVSIYKRTAPNGSPCFMVANYAGTKRRFDSYADESLALEAANKLARQLSERDTLTASMTREQAVEYAAAVQTLKPLGIALPATVATVAECLKHVGGLADVTAACRFYAARHKPTVAKRVADAVAEMLSVKAARGASERYLRDLRGRLNKFAAAFQKDARNVTTPEIQAWLDSQKLGTQSYANNRRVLSVLFEFCVARGYASDNPVARVENVKVHNREIQIFTPSEVSKLLSAASSDFLPTLALGAFAGLRSAEIERLEWSAIDLKAGHIVVGADAAKTASRRIVPIAGNLAEWLAPYAERTGKVWTGGWLYKAQQDTANAAGVTWKKNGARHSFASYSFALCADAGRVAGYCGNSPAVIHRHYKQLCTPADAQKFFSIKPAAVVTALPTPAAGISQ